MQLTEELLLGERLPRVFGAQTLGATGALRITGELLKGKLGHSRIYLPDPTWANHTAIFASSGLEIVSYPYYKSCALDEAGMLSALAKLPKGSAVLFHATCHNPTGIDPTAQQWGQMLEVVQSRELLPIFDCAYQGLGDGLEEDVAGVRSFVAADVPLFVCYSYSKNLALYGERIGALFVAAGSEAEATCFGSQVRAYARANYSNPALHGEQIVKGVLGNDELRQVWHGDLSAMQQRLALMRTLLREKLEAAVKRDFGFLASQRGLFSFIGLEPTQAERLTQDFAIYLPKSGRISVTGLNSENIDYVIQALADVLCT